MNDLTATVDGYRTPRGPMAAYRRAPLRVALIVDAAVTATNAVAYLAAAGPLSDLLGLSPSLLRGTGLFLLGFAGAVGLAATRPTIPRPAVYAIVAANVVWALDSLALAVVGWGTPTLAGTAWIVAQAAVVAGFAALQAAALRTAAP